MKVRPSRARFLARLSLAFSVVAALEVLLSHTVFLSYLFFLPSMWAVARLDVWEWCALWHGVVLYGVIGCGYRALARGRPRKLLHVAQAGLASLILLALCDLSCTVWARHVRDPIYPSRPAIVLLLGLYLPIVAGLSFSAAQGNAKLAKKLRWWTPTKQTGTRVLRRHRFPLSVGLVAGVIGYTLLSLAKTDNWIPTAFHLLFLPSICLIYFLPLTLTMHSAEWLTLAVGVALYILAGELTVYVRRARPRTGGCCLLWAAALSCGFILLFIRAATWSFHPFISSWQHRFKLFAAVYGTAAGVLTVAGVLMCCRGWRARLGKST